MLSPLESCRVRSDPHHPRIGADHSAPYISDRGWISGAVERELASEDGTPSNSPLDKGERRKTGGWRLVGRPPTPTLPLKGGGRIRRIEANRLSLPREGAGPASPG